MVTAQPRRRGRWVADDAVWLVSKRLADEVRRFLHAQGDTAVPGEDKNDRLFDVWQEYGAVIPNPVTGGAIRARRVEGVDYAHERPLLRFPLAGLWPEVISFPRPCTGASWSWRRPNPTPADGQPRGARGSHRVPVRDHIGPVTRSPPHPPQRCSIRTTMRRAWSRPRPVCPRGGRRCRRRSVHCRPGMKIQARQPSALAVASRLSSRVGSGRCHNESGALVHFVTEGLFLISTGLFAPMTCIRPRRGAGSGSAGDWPGKSQYSEAVCGTGWNRKPLPTRRCDLSPWRVARAKPGKALNGVVVLRTDVSSPVPRVNPHLQRAPDFEAAHRMTSPLEPVSPCGPGRSAAIASLAGSRQGDRVARGADVTPTAGLLVVTLLFAHTRVIAKKAENATGAALSTPSPAASPHYPLAADRIPGPATRLFLGRGFRWTAVHQPPGRFAPVEVAAHFRELAMLYHAALAHRFESRLKHAKRHRVARLTHKVRGGIRLAPMPEVGGDPALHGVGADGREVCLPLAERVQAR
ncbi:MAG: TraI domain-containing protein [Betaproteobacteria bacterium]|nr:TraI domain-containing protein [Betaproteobacteria bacterium]